METKSKRRRIIQSYISQPRPDLSATFESLSDDPLITILEFVGMRSYISFGGINKQCKEVYLMTEGGITKETSLFGYGPLSRITDRIERSDMENNRKLQVFVGAGVVFHNRRDVMDWALAEKNKKVLRGICNIAIQEERFDILDKVWNNVEEDDDKEYIFESVGQSAALRGKLNILKWFETKGASINKKRCATEAAKGGQLHILKWLREEKGLELKGGYYSSACRRGQLHVLKWLREKEVPWDGAHSFINAIRFALLGRRGNLDVLQWLHDEGCPWSNETLLRVLEDESSAKPEVIDWLRTNGYIDRIRLR